jgi:tetratricopeptide (TPR) repeat protein
LLKDYRKKVGIDVPTEKEHAAEIDEALSIGQRAMQRGVYATAVSALEKVTQWCSTNSKVGSKVYLELAMAYEAVGRTKEAVTIYKTLSECRMEDVKYNAKRLLYGLEAMEVMKSISSDFSRKKTRNAFIDATGLDNFASNFDDVYQTAYVDLDNSYYKKLTESVVRSTREARQILIQAQGKGEVSRTRIVQALRCLSRQFDDLLQSEIDSSATLEPTAYLNGKPIDRGAPESRYGAQIGILGDFTLLSANEMIQNIDGEWQLQLLADKSGDGVSFFNTSIAVQKFSTDEMTFSASGPSGLGSENCSGRITMDDSKRVLSKEEVDTSKAGISGILSMITGGKNSGFSAAVSKNQQIVSVDSLLLITRCARGSKKSGDLDKEYFGVWRRVIPQDDGFP